MASNNLENAGESETQEAGTLSTGNNSEDEMSIPQIPETRPFDTLSRLKVARALALYVS